MITDEELADLERLDLEATPNLVWGWSPPEESDESPGEYMAATCKPDSKRVRTVWTEDAPEGVVRIVAFVGDGPTSDANAEFFAEARNMLPKLLASFRDLKERSEKLVDDNNALRANSYNTRIADLEAENEKLKTDFELKSVVHDCCVRVLELNKERGRFINLSVALETELAANALIVETVEDWYDEGGSDLVSKLMQAVQVKRHGLDVAELES